MFEEKITFDRFVRFLLGLAGFVLIIYAIHYLSGVLIPFAVAWVVAYMLYPIVRFFQYRCRLRSRVAAIAVTLLLLFGIIFGLLYLAVPPMMYFSPMSRRASDTGMSSLPRCTPSTSRSAAS